MDVCNLLISMRRKSSWIFPGNTTARHSKKQWNAALLDQCSFIRSFATLYQYERHLSIYLYCSISFSQKLISANKKHQMLKDSQPQSQPAGKNLDHLLFLQIWMLILLAHSYFTLKVEYFYSFFSQKSCIFIYIKKSGKINNKVFTVVTSRWWDY